MLILRRDQIAAFEQDALCRFEDEMVEHLKKFSPKHCEVIGEPWVRRVIRLGMERAGQYGFTKRGPVRFYLELMVMFGSYFATDPQLPQAAQILNEAGNQMVWADRFYRLTLITWMEVTAC